MVAATGLEAAHPKAQMCELAGPGVSAAWRHLGDAAPTIHSCGGQGPRGQALGQDP